MVGDVARHTQEKTFPQEHQLPVERSGREIAKWSQHVALAAGVQALRKEIISDRTTWKIICVLGARLAHHTAHELVGEQKLNFFLCVVILNYFFEQN